VARIEGAASRVTTEMPEWTWFRRGVGAQLPNGNIHSGSLSPYSQFGGLKSVQRLMGPRAGLVRMAAMYHFGGAGPLLATSRRTRACV